MDLAMDNNATYIILQWRRRVKHFLRHFAVQLLSAEQADTQRHTGISPNRLALLAVHTVRADIGQLCAYAKTRSALALRVGSYSV